MCAEYNKNLTSYKIAVFASGTGSNFKAIVNSIENGILCSEIAVLITNNPDAGALGYAKEKGISTAVINKKLFPEENGVTTEILSALSKHGADFIILAGYMKMIGSEIVRAYRNRILNIHPALLPSFGGEGMYGIHVHEAAIKYGVRFSGVTVHIVDDAYDMGPIVLQKIVPVDQEYTPQELQKRILTEEHKIYTEAIRLFEENKIEVSGRRVIIRE